MNKQRSELDVRPWESWWTWADDVRRLRGDFLEAAGLGPQTSPSRIVRKWNTAHLLAYQTPNRDQPVVLAIPAPIKTSYIWDLLPEVSVVRRCQEEGFQVYLIAWQELERGDDVTGLDEYAENSILKSVQEISAETGASKLFIAGHSLGGTLAAIFSSLHSETLHGLIELEGPIQFDRNIGRLEAAISRSPPARTITEQLGSVAGSFLNVGSSWSDSVTFNREPLVDWLQSAISPKALRIHNRVRRWTLDELPMPQRLFEETVDGLYRENRFAAGTLQVSGRRADPRAITSPILAVFDPRSRILPIASADAYRTLTGSTDVEMLEYNGDIGVMLQHVGILVGENAHKLVWPHIFSWMRKHLHN